MVQLAFLVGRYSSSEMDITAGRKSLQLLLDVHVRNSSRSLTAWFPGKSRVSAQKRQHD